MSNVTIAVDLSKNVFEIAASRAAESIHERRRMTRQQFDDFWLTREISVKSEAQQALMTLHRVRSQWMSIRNLRCSVWHPVRESHVGPEPARLHTRGRIYDCSPSPAGASAPRSANSDYVPLDRMEESIYER